MLGSSTNLGDLTWPLAWPSSPWLAEGEDFRVPDTLGNYSSIPGWGILAAVGACSNRTGTSDPLGGLEAVISLCGWLHLPELLPDW